MTQMEMIKNELSEHVGKRVIVKANRGRKKIITRKGVLESIYPSLFVVNIVDGDLNHRNVSFTYSDILTSTVQVTILDDDVEMPNMKIS
ncbi:Veg family protein [Peptoniphilus sp. KCTC 25270]|uniref:Veg family protein n=1 Tax=Peptoniphilus sp. KCTC 25270 TaxID=2897414 RepID=UPI001E46845C|nr:Veg family protein [Peptoniphilus sp. KCTC 25270]MCD1146764.1 Veg family protein [Peptoniphilus sp. KCTC 25270]